MKTKTKRRPLSEKEAARKKRMVTVYPAAWAEDVLGRSSLSYNAAIECWAGLIARASADNAKTFTADEWRTLREHLANFDLSPSTMVPGRLLSGLIPVPNFDILADKVQFLDYVHAWALWLAVGKSG